MTKELDATTLLLQRMCQCGQSRPRPQELQTKALSPQTLRPQLLLPVDRRQREHRLIFSSACARMGSRKCYQMEGADAFALVRSREVERSVVDTVKQIGECNAGYGHRDIDDLCIGDTGLLDLRYHIGLNCAARCD